MIIFIHDLPKDKFISTFLNVMELKAKANIIQKSEYILDNMSENQQGTFFGVDLTKLIFAANNKYHLWLIVYKYMLKHSNMKYKKYIITTDKHFNLNEEVYQEFYNDEPYNMANYKYLMDILYGNCSGNINNITMDNFIDEVLIDFFDNQFLIPVLIRTCICEITIQ